MTAHVISLHAVRDALRLFGVSPFVRLWPWQRRALAAYSFYDLAGVERIARHGMYGCAFSRPVQAISRTLVSGGGQAAVSLE